MPFSGLLTAFCKLLKDQTAPGVYKIMPERDGCSVMPAVDLLNGYTPPLTHGHHFSFVLHPCEYGAQILKPVFSYRGYSHRLDLSGFIRFRKSSIALKSQVFSSSVPFLWRLKCQVLSSSSLFFRVSSGVRFMLHLLRQPVQLHDSIVKL